MTARDRTIVLVLAGLAVLAGFWFAVLKPKRAETQVLGTQIAAQRERLQGAEQTVATGLRAKADYASDYATVTKLGQAVPADDDLATLLYQLDSVSHGARVDFESLVRTAASPAPTTSAPAAGTSGASSSSPSSSASAPAGTSTTQPAATATLPPGATVGTAGLATLPFTFTFKGSFAGLRRLLADVHGLVRSDDDSVAVRGRLLTVDGVSLSGSTTDLSKLEARIVATAYLSPATKDPVNGGTATPGSTGTGSTGAPAPSTSAITVGTN
jgi:Tfp pilus assembly protein PilO